MGKRETEKNNFSSPTPGTYQSTHPRSPESELATDLLDRETSRPTLNIVEPGERPSKYLEVKNQANKMLFFSSYLDKYTFIKVGGPI